MNSIVVISDNPAQMDSLYRSLQHLGSIYTSEGSRLIVEGEFGWFAVDLDSCFEAHLSEQELELIRSELDSQHYVSITYSERLAVDRAISSWPTEGKILVDNDHGLIAPIGEIRLRIDLGLDWNKSAL